ncbi:NAD(P)H-hydrate dehydratase [bacterium]|nr:NAD(P)H-hydrate dehydratase [bacterium]
MYFLKADEIRSLDASAIAQGTPGLVLMERAGYAAFRFLTDVFAPTSKRFLVLGGAGNNGGDAWVAARYLIQSGLHCDVALLGPILKLKGDALIQFRRLEAQGKKISSLNDPKEVSDYLSIWQGDVIIDGLTGTGFKGSANALLASAISAVNAHPARKLALDIPSGLNADGSESRLFVKADWTVTFGQGKLASLTKASEFLGRTEIIDIGLPAPRNAESPFFALSLKDARALLPKPDNASYKHKRGHLLLLAGAPQMGGAALLAAKAASIGGAGLVTAVIPKELEPAFNSALPHILTLTLSGRLEEDLDKLAQLAEKCDAAAAGPGLPDDEYHSALLKALAASPIKKQIWDAGALSIYARERFEIPEDLELVFTPHLGEFKRLMDYAPETDDFARKEAAADLCENLNVTVLLKGHHTVVKAPQRLSAVNLSGNPYLSTAGTGDLLTGLTGAFLAQGLNTYDAAMLAAYYHGLAADFAAPIGGRTASDFSDYLGRALSYDF